MKTPVIIGLHGCYCHPFESWEECEKYHKQKFSVGEPVKNRHTNATGTIHEVYKEKGYVTVKYGKNKSDIHQEHVAMLIRIK